MTRRHRFDPDLSQRALTLEEYRRHEAAGEIDRPLTWRPGRHQLDVDVADDRERRRLARLEREHRRALTELEAA